MTKFVRVKHPNVKSEGVVPEASLAHWGRAGWKPVDEKPAEQPKPASTHVENKGK